MDMFLYESVSVVVLFTCLDGPRDDKF